MSTPSGFDKVSGLTIDAVREAKAYRWSLRQFISCVKEARVVAAEDELRSAKWEVEIAEREEGRGA